MKSFQRVIRGVMLVGQLGFSAITPPLVLVWLAHLAVSRLGWGVWVMIAAIIVGIVTAFSSVRSLLRLWDKPKDKPQSPTSFNDHR